MRIVIKTQNAVELGKKLNDLHRSAFPSAIRNTLNDAAFDMKRKQLPESARRNFKVKQPTFFKKYTGVDKAQGFNVNSMKSVTGFLNATDPKVRKAIEGMDKQEFGGIINDGLRYLKEARGGNLGGKVRRENYYDKTKIISGRNRSRKGTVKSKFVARVYRAHKENKPMFMNSMKGNFVVKVKKAPIKKNGKLSFTLKFLMMDRRVKPSKIKATHFSKEAAEHTKTKLAQLYQKNAEYQFRKYLR